MTEKQRNYILYLDTLCVEQGLNIRAKDDELLGKDWFKTYRNFTFEYTNEVIDKLKTALGIEITKKKRGKSNGANR